MSDQRQPSPVYRRGLALLLFTFLFFLAGCASRQPLAVQDRKFDFSRDTFAFPNELAWEYGYDADGHWSSQQREPSPEYSLRCFVVSRTAVQFFQNARFDAAQPVEDEQRYHHLVEQVLSRSPRDPPKPGELVVIPGYSDLRSFSKSHEKLLKETCGGAWQSYVQRGHWRMVLPFSRAHQERTAKEVVSQVITNKPVILHLLRFPKLGINHAVVVYDAQVELDQIVFQIYDPNSVEGPRQLLFDRRTRTFVFPRNNYFKGGPLQVYQVFHRWAY